MRYIEPPVSEGFSSRRPYIYLRQKRDFPITQRQIHWHQSPELIQVVSGSLSASVDCQDFLLGPGDILYIPPGTLFSYTIADAELDQLILAPPLMAETQLRSEAGRVPCCGIEKDSGEAARQIAGLLEDLAGLDRIMEGAVSRVRQALMLAAGGGCSLIPSRSQPVSPRRIAHLREALEVIEQRIGERMTLQQLAGAVDLSEKYFCRFFLNMTGQTPFTYINRLKVEYACDLLINEKISIGEVAGRLGFHDVNYFIKIFKRYTGLTPKRFASRYYLCASYPLRY